MYILQAIFKSRQFVRDQGFLYHSWGFRILPEVLEVLGNIPWSGVDPLGEK